MPITEIDKNLMKEIKESVLDSRHLSENATKNSEAQRYAEENNENEIRTPFFRDTDRIIHTKTYTRYIDKTQVFYLFENDHLTHRVLHVQLVAKIARTLGRVLKYNEDLIEAIALGHDVGHTPFGHKGERFVDAYLKERGEGCFHHNVQSFRQLHKLENGKGINLTVQTLDGILCHNGEWLCSQYKNDKDKSKEKLLEEYNAGLSKEDSYIKKLRPMTMEGCIVRVSDVIAYIGRDIEDAVVVQLIKRDDIPQDIVKVLGNTNKEIVNSLVLDIINNSFGKDYISFSQEVFEALNALKKWNFNNIYESKKKTSEDEKIERMFGLMLDSIIENKLCGNVKTQYEKWRREQGAEYLESTPAARLAVDYLSGMTDDFLMNSYREIVIPKSFGMSFEFSSFSTES